jgi:hypothetical protein
MMNTYTALVRIQVGAHYRAVPVETRAYSSQDAKWILQGNYGFTAVISGPILIKPSKSVYETETAQSIKPMTPEKARIDSLEDQKERAADALKSERERQKIRSAQIKLNSL